MVGGEDGAALAAEDEEVGDVQARVLAGEGRVEVVGHGCSRVAGRPDPDGPAPGPGRYRPMNQQVTGNFSLMMRSPETSRTTR